MTRHIAVLTATLALWAAVPVLAADEAAPTKPAPISGTVVDRDGKPIAWAQVKLEATLGGKRRSQTVATDRSGRFRSTLTSGPKEVSQVTVTALARGYCCVRQWRNTSDPNPLTITLHPGCTLKGRVVDEKRKPLAGARVALDYCYGYGNNVNVNVELPDQLRSVTTGKDGSFSLAYLPNPDDFQYITGSLAISAPGRALVHKSVQKEWMADVLEVSDPLECKLDGVLYLPGKSGFAPENTQITLQVPTDQGSEGRYAEVGKDGKFHFTQLPPRKVNVMLGQGRRDKPLKWAMPAVMDVELSPEKPAELELVLAPGALVKGTVVDKATGKVIESARLSVYHSGRPEGAFSETVMTDAKGEFAVRAAAGEVTIGVDAVESKDRHIYLQPDDRPTMTLTVADGEDKSDVVFKADLSQSYDSMWEVQNKPIPPDFELTPGSYDLAWNPDIDCSQSVYMRSRYEGEKVNSHVKKLPEFASTRAKRMAFPLDAPGDDGLLFVVLDESKGTGKGWDTAYFDLNRNGDLTDDEPVRFTTATQGGRARVGYVTVEAHQGPAEGARTDHPMQVRLTIYPTGDDPYVRLERKGGWKGTVDSNKGKLECVAIDANCNGVYGDFAEIKGSLEPDSPGDSIFVNTNEFSQLVVTGWSPHCIGLQKIARVGDKFYQIKVSSLGDKVTIEPYTGGMGQLLVRGEKIEGLKASTRSMYVVSEAGYYSFQNCEGKPVLLPVGKYRLPYCAMVFDTENKLNMTCSPDSWVSVEAEKQSVVTVSGKLSLAIDSDTKEMVLKPGSTETIVWDIKIGGKTTVSALGDQNRSNAPKVNFLRNGKLLKTATAGYT